MSPDYSTPEERTAAALERMATALETLADRDKIFQEVVSAAMQPDDMWRALAPDGTYKCMSYDVLFVKEVAAEDGLTVERMWKHTATEWRPER